MLALKFKANIRIRGAHSCLYVDAPKSTLVGDLRNALVVKLNANILKKQYQWLTCVMREIGFFTALIMRWFAQSVLYNSDFQARKNRFSDIGANTQSASSSGMRMRFDCIAHGLN